ncbi:AAEL010147-PA, partial [Aedes aegypti]
PAPPPPPINADPEYEVIDVANQQYSNTPPPIPVKSADIKRMTVMKCDLCGSVTPAVRCAQCENNIFCASCDDRYHRHPKRQSHIRTVSMKPPLPPKGEASTSGPLPPPRRNKRPGSFLFPSPLLGRKQDQDQTIPTTIPQVLNNAQKPPQPPPSPALSLREKMNSLKRFIHPSNRPLPDPPENKIHSSTSSLDTVSKRSFAIGTPKSMSSTMEKIQNNTAATLDRMTMLQQRYRQHQETMRADNDRISNESNALNSNNQQFMFSTQRTELGSSPDPGLPNPRSTSVFNLNQMHHQPVQPNMWGFSPLQQAQSMAQINYNQMHWSQMNPWMAGGQSQNGSNMSLNMPPSQHYPHDQSGYPPGWNNTWGGMYPYPMGMMPMMHGESVCMAMPPPRSRANSRSRAASPALSVKSRKSTMSMRNLNRNSYINDLTDDEDSDEDFSKIRGRRDRRHRVASDSFTNDSDAEFERRKQQKLRNSGLLSPKRMESDSVTGESDAAREKVKSSGNRKLSDTEKNKTVKAKTSKTTPKKIPSDAHTPDTDGDHKRRFVTKKQLKKNSSTEFIPQDSEVEFEQRKEEKQKISNIVNSESESKKSPSKSNDEDEIEHIQSVVAKNQINEMKSESIQFSMEDSPSPRPTIPAPDHEWECTFCTYVNEAGVKICAICCKTVSTGSTINPETPRSPPPDVVQGPPSEKQTVQSPASDVVKQQTIIPQPTKEIDTKKKAQHQNRYLENDLCTVTKSNISQYLSCRNSFRSRVCVYENHEIRSPLQVKPENPKGSGEIKQNLDCEVTKHMNKVVSETVSTGCGTSPPREASIGTSPPPQDMSTQVISLPPTPHELSPQPHQLLQKEPHPSSNTSPHHEEDSMSYLDRAIHQIIQTAAARTNFGFTRPLDQHKYRAMNDLRRIDTKPSQAPARPTTHNEMLPERRQTVNYECFAFISAIAQYNFTADELQAALGHCRDKHPVQWLRDNWYKLVGTVQTLATKYGHEKRENTIGTISSTEAREALRLHKGNIWHAITECIEQRQKKYHEIASKGNFTREDIVTSLTAHHGNLELAMVELSKTQLKPFLMRIWGPPNGADNDSALKEDRSTEIQEFISAHVEKELLSDQASESATTEVEAVSCPEVKPEACMDATNHTAIKESATSNTLILRDIEKLIDQMEKNQENKSEDVLKNIQHLLAKLVEKNGSRPASQASVRSESCERITVKSPIPLPRTSQLSEDDTKPIYEDIRNFMTENIQEILPSLVDQVQQELQSVPIHAERTLEDDIRETLINANYSEDEYSTISIFPFKTYDEDTPGFPNQKKKSSMGFNTAQEEDNEYANIQDFLMKAIRTERLTNEFEQYKTKNYRFDSSSDEARNTAESTDYYDIVAVNQRIQDLLSRNREVVSSLGPLEVVPPIPTETPVEEAIYVNTSEIAAMTAVVPPESPPETSDRKQVKKRRVSRIPVNKDNYLQRRPVKSSSEKRTVVEIQTVQQPLTSEENHLTKNSSNDQIQMIPNTLPIALQNHEPQDKITNTEENNVTSSTIGIVTNIPQDTVQIKESSNSPLPEVVNNSKQSPNPSVSILPETSALSTSEEISRSPEPMPELSNEEPLAAPSATNLTIIEIVDAPLPEQEPLRDESTSISLSKPSNNLSDLVLDTKRLIQQMKDEIASDMATMADEDEVYEDEYYEEDEYGDWTEGDEMIEEWDSNEEYEMDENGDYFEYEDEDDDGSVIAETVQNSPEISENSELTLVADATESTEPTLVAEENLNLTMKNVQTLLNAKLVIGEFIKTAQQVEEVDTKEIANPAESVNGASTPAPVAGNSNLHVEDSVTLVPGKAPAEPTVVADTMPNDINQVTIQDETESPTHVLDATIEMLNSVARDLSEQLRQSTTSKKTSTPSTPTTPSGLKTAKLVKTKTISDTKKKTATTSDPSSQFLNKTQKEPSKSITITPKPKPSKLVQPKAFINNKLTNPITTPTQPNVAASTSKASIPSGEPGSSRSTPGPSSSKGTTPGGSRESSVTSEQKRKLRKKYMETCFSDDYFTSDDEDDYTTTVTESESRTIIRSLVKPFEPLKPRNNHQLKRLSPQVQARRLLDAGHVMSYQQAEVAVQLIEMRYAQDNAIWAANQCHTIDEAKDLLQKECELCLGVYPMNEIISLLKCTHTCCLDCAKVYFTEEIMHRSITNCNCPYCKEPDLNSADVTEDDVVEYFSNLDILLKNIVDAEVHDLFQRKLRDRTLMQDPNFKWCVDCSSGFIARPRQKRLICPDCGSITCASCRKPWESQHEGISCEQFAAWKEANDPELQAQGVARHLQAHGISCPNCKFKYSLSRGGCMHFTCTQCKFEFCFGCNKPFMMGAKCDVSPYCAKLGLHAHHPRNCLFYLRDKEPKDLQTLLTMHNVSYDTEPSELMKREFLEGGGASMKCPIPLQRETPAGLMDTICNGEVPDGYAGLCRIHYVEYLVGVVSKAQVDPLPILDLTDCVQELRRRGIPLPERGPWDTDEIYREMCQKVRSYHTNH